MYILLYILIVLLQYQLIRNTQKNWFNHEIKYIKWSESHSKDLLPIIYFDSLIPLLGLTVMFIYETKYWTFKTIKIINP